MLSEHDIRLNMVGSVKDPCSTKDIARLKSWAARVSRKDLEIFLQDQMVGIPERQPREGTYFVGELQRRVWEKIAELRTANHYRLKFLSTLGLPFGELGVCDGILRLERKDSPQSHQDIGIKFGVDTVVKPGPCTDIIYYLDRQDFHESGRPVNDFFAEENKIFTELVDTCVSILTNSEN